jgi:predicted nucleic acid-binding protein
MRFWDASAIVPLIVAEEVSASLLELLTTDPVMAVWWGSPVEVCSAVSRREREGALDAASANAALQRLRALGRAWHEITPSDPIRAIAQRTLRVHPLRAADSLQLAAAIAIAERDPASLPIVCLDQRLADAARREGFEVVGI